MNEGIDTVVSYDGWRDRVADSSMVNDSAGAASKRAAVVSLKIIRRRLLEKEKRIIMTKKSNRIIKITTVLMALLLLGIAAAPASATVLFNVTLDGNVSNGTVSSLIGGTTGVALNFTIQNTTSAINFFNITLPGFTVPVITLNAQSNINTSGLKNLTLCCNGQNNITVVTGGTGTGVFVNLSIPNLNTTQTPLGNTSNTTSAGEQIFINLTNLVVPIITNNSDTTQTTRVISLATNNSDAVTSSISITTLNVNEAYSNLTNASLSKVANNSDKFLMNLTAKDANGNVVTGATFTLSSNRTTQYDTLDVSSVTTNATGQAVFNVTSTLAGVAKITANGTNLGLANLTNQSGVVFVSGPATKLAIFGPDSVTGVTTINQTIAVQDANGNNVTLDKLATYSLQASITSGSASITSTNPIIVTNVDANNVSNSSAFPYNYTATYEPSFNITAAVGAGAVTLQVTSNVTLTGTSKTVTFYGNIASLNVTLNKTSMFANNGNDTILVTTKLKDASGGTGNDIKTSGVTISLNSLTPTLFNATDISKTNITDANGIATFTVNSSALSGSGTIGATVTINPAGGTGQTGSSPTVTLLQAPSIANSVVVNSTNGVILTGANSTITATINDYNSTGVAMSGYSVRFNIATGDATFANNGLTVYTATTASTGNATANITSTNASTNISVNVTIVDEKLVTRKISGAPQNFTVTPSVASQFSITPGRNVGLKNVNGTVQTFIIRTKDSVGNFNTTANGILNITTSNQALGNLSNYSNSTTVLNNLSINIVGGNASFNYTVNSSTADTAVLTLNSSLGINDTITITTSGAQGIRLTVSKSVQDVNINITATTQLTDLSGNALGISGTTISFVVKNATNVIQQVLSNTTNGTGAATFNFTQSTAGVYTANASNGTLSNSTTVTFAGPAASVVVTANNTAPAVNTTVTINATVKDASGVTSGSIDTAISGFSISFLADGSQFATATITNGLASTTYTKATAGAVTITAFFNATLQNTTTVTFGAAPAANGTIAGNVTNATSGLAILGATVTAGSVTATTPANGSYSISIASGTYTVTASATGYVSNSTSVTVTSGATVTQNFALTPSAVAVKGNDTLGIYQNSTGNFFLKNSNSAGAADISFQFGPGGLKPLKGDYDGSGNDTAGVYNLATGTFFLKNTNSAGAADTTVQFGPVASALLPVIGDWDGSGNDTIGLYNTTSGTFFLKNSNSAGAADVTAQFGPGGSDFLPVVGDWDGSGNDTIGLYKISTGTFFLKNSNSAGAADTTVQFGPAASDLLPVVGAWTGSASDTIGLYNTTSGTFFLKNANSAGAADTTAQYGPGGSGILPVVGDWDGQ